MAQGDRYITPRARGRRGRHLPLGERGREEERWEYQEGAREREHERSIERQQIQLGGVGGMQERGFGEAAKQRKFMSSEARQRGYQRALTAYGLRGPMTAEGVAALRAQHLGEAEATTGAPTRAAEYRAKKRVGYRQIGGKWVDPEAARKWDVGASKRVQWVDRSLAEKRARRGAGYTGGAQMPISNYGPQAEAWVAKNFPDITTLPADPAYDTSRLRYVRRAITAAAAQRVSAGAQEGIAREVQETLDQIGQLGQEQPVQPGAPAPAPAAGQSPADVAAGMRGPTAGMPAVQPSLAGVSGARGPIVAPGVGGPVPQPQPTPTPTPAPIQGLPPTMESGVPPTAAPWLAGAPAAAPAPAAPPAVAGPQPLPPAPAAPPPAPPAAEPVAPPPTARPGAARQAVMGRLREAVGGQPTWTPERTEGVLQKSREEAQAPLRGPQYQALRRRVGGYKGLPTEIPSEFPAIKAPRPPETPAGPEVPRPTLPRARAGAGAAGGGLPGAPRSRTERRQDEADTTRRLTNEVTALAKSMQDHLQSGLRSPGEVISEFTKALRKVSPENLAQFSRIMRTFRGTFAQLAIEGKTPEGYAGRSQKASEAWNKMIEMIGVAPKPGALARPRAGVEPSAGPGPGPGAGAATISEREKQFGDAIATKTKATKAAYDRLPALTGHTGAAPFVHEAMPKPAYAAKIYDLITTGPTGSAWWSAVREMAQYYQNVAGLDRSAALTRTKKYVDAAIVNQFLGGKGISQSRRDKIANHVERVFDKEWRAQP